MQSAIDRFLRFPALVLWLLVIVFIAACTPPGPKALLKGERLIREEKYTQAIEELKTATQLMPDEPRAWNFLGLAYHGAEMDQLAFTAYRQALTLDSELASARYNVGVLFLDQQRYSDAIEQFEQYLKLAPDSPRGLTKLGLAYLGDHQIAAAASSIQKSLQLSPEQPEALNAAGMILMQRDRPQDAVKYFGRALERRKNYPSALLNLAVAFDTRLNNPAFALEKYRQYLKLKPRPENWVSVQQAVQRLESRQQQWAGAPASSAPPQPSTLSPELLEVPAHPSAQETPPVVATGPRSSQPETPKTTQPTNSTEVAMHESEERPESTQARAEPAEADPPPKSTQPGEATASPTEKELVQTPDTNQVSQVQTAEVAVASSEPSDEETGEPAPESSTPEESAPIEVASVAEPAEEASEITSSESSGDSVSIPGRDAKPSAETIDSGNLEVVTLPDLPRFRTARDVRPATASPDQTVGVRLPGPDNPSPRTNRESYRPPSMVVPREESSGLFSKLNPKNWFSDDEPLPPMRYPPSNPELSTGRTTGGSTPGERQPLPARRFSYQDFPLNERGDSNEAMRWLQTGYKAHQRRQMGEAMQAYRNAVSADPTSFLAHYNLGVAAFQSGDVDLALRSYEKAVALQPNSADARYNFALALESSDYLVDAALQLETLLGKHPDHAKGHLALANLYAQQLDRPMRARQHYLEVVRLEPQHPQVQAIRRWLATHP